MGQPEEVSDTVALSTIPGKNGIVFPSTFTIRPQDDSKTKFSIRGDSGSSPLSIACEYNSSRGSMDWDAEEATLYLISGNGQRLATIKHYRGYANATLHDSMEFRISYGVQGDQKAVHEFSIPKLATLSGEKANRAGNWSSLLSPAWC
ncbi:hypothetical protein MRS44_005254 [Fusarium solani]|uniref:uncharacterized protein n=1 Tax=Fusarium solani TaxID=169388 RepID=UPI0032C43052|nr:hypothetical protein MRS44_005254 [Fusarium solani]